MLKPAKSQNLHEYPDLVMHPTKLEQIRCSPNGGR